MINRILLWTIPQASLRYSLGEATDRVVDYVLPLEQMEMRRHGVVPYSLFRIIFDELQEFSEGTVSAEETSIRLQSRVGASLRLGKCISSILSFLMHSVKIDKVA